MLMLTLSASRPLHALTAGEYARLETCRFCKRKLTLVRTIVESDTGAVVHMFECYCGERIWRD